MITVRNTSDGQISERIKLTFNLSNRQPLLGKLNYAIQEIKPELENLTVTPLTEEQKFKSEKYGYDEVIVERVTADIDPNIKSENIKVGETILGVPGGYKGIDTSDADATANDIAMNKTAYVNGEKLEGTLFELETASIATDDVVDNGSWVNIKSVLPQDYLFRKDSSITYNVAYKTLANAIGITPEKLITGNKVIGVSGNATSDADATAADILKDKTAYVNGEKIEGTYEPLDTSDANATAIDILKDKTAYVNGVKVVGTYEESGGDGEYNAKITRSSSAITTFRLTKLLQEINNLDLTGITSMSDAFSGCSYLKKIKNISNSSKVTTMYNAFRGCGSSSEVGFEIEEFDTSNTTNMREMFSSSGLIKAPKLNTEKVTNMTGIFSNMSKLKDVSDWDFSHITDMNQTFLNSYGPEEFGDFNTINTTYFKETFYGCQNLKTLGVINAEKVNSMSEVIYSRYGMALQNFGGFKDLGKAYTEKTANVSYYTLDLSTCNSLTHDSLMNVINNLYDLNLTYNVANGGLLYTQKLILGTTNLAKLTAEEIAIATAKGWTVS